MEPDEPRQTALDAADDLRRAMLGDAYVDAQGSDPNPTMREFQHFITATAWGRPRGPDRR